MVAPAEVQRSSSSRSLLTALALLASSAVLLGLFQLLLALPNAGAAPWVHLLFILVFWIYVAAGIVAWWRRPSNRIGALIVMGGFALFAGSLANTGLPVLTGIGTMTATAVLAVVVHLLHAFPSGRLQNTVSRATVLAGYVVALVLQAPLYLFSAQATSPLSVADRPDLLMGGIWVQRVAGLAVVLMTAGILAQRLRHSDAKHRRVLSPLFAYGILAVLVIPISVNVLERVPGMTSEARFGIQMVLLGGIPVAFVLGVLRGGFARTGELEELGVWLGATDAARPTLTTALRRVLGDASIEIVFWMPDRALWADGSGRTVELPTPGAQRSSVEIEVDDNRVGAIIYDASIIADAELVHTAGRVVAIAVERERLTAELRASQTALLNSRARLVEAADRERGRIAQNLHDGLQVQLVILALGAQQVANTSGATPTTREQATTLRKGIDGAAADLRQLVHDVMPSTLIERGLSAAAEDLVDRMPVPTRLHLAITEEALPEDIKRTAYFIVAEGLTNALKHSQADAFTVRLKLDGARLLIEVHDNGIGGATLAGGRGLRGLADRAEVVGGELHIRSEPGTGTTLRSELPCVW